MRLPKPLVIVLCLTSLLSLSLSSCVAFAAPVLQIKITVGRSSSTLGFLGDQVYSVGEGIAVCANITLDGSSAANLAAIELDSPYGNPYLIRTIKTGNVSSMYFRVQFVDLYTCDQLGNPMTLFNPGSTVYVNITIKNIDVVQHSVRVGLYAQLSDNTPAYAYYPEGFTIIPGVPQPFLVQFTLPVNAPSGQAMVFASLFTDYPANLGYPYCPEQTANFSIRASTPAMPQQPDYNNMTFSLPRKNVKLGNYTIHAVTNFNAVQTATDNKQFKVILLGDINKDYVVNMKDIAVCVQLFNTTPNSPNWNPDADVNKDGIVNMKDIALCVALFQNNAIP